MHIIESETLLTVYTYPRSLVRVFSLVEKTLSATDGRTTYGCSRSLQKLSNISGCPHRAFYKKALYTCMMQRIINKSKGWRFI